MVVASPQPPQTTPLFGPHGDRVRAILQEHPEIRDLAGRNAGSYFVTLALTAMQFAFAYLLATQPWWLVILVAYVVGAFASHALFVMIHECSHDLVFRSPTLNLLTGMLANLPLIAPLSISFERYHLKHHAYLGDYPTDPDIPYPLEAWLVGRSALRKALWLLIYPVLLLFRTLRVREVKVIDRWIIANFVVQIGFDLAVLWWFGWKPFLYLGLSTWFSISLHPLGARWVQEHFMVHPPQPTYSYYGPLNLVACNMGYHNEHHDFPAVPWNRLPQVRRVGGEWYSRLASHTSWTKLLLQFVFDPKFHLHARMAAEPGLPKASSV